MEAKEKETATATVIGVRKITRRKIFTMLRIVTFTFIFTLTYLKITPRKFIIMLIIVVAFFATFTFIQHLLEESARNAQKVNGVLLETFTTLKHTF